MNARRPKVLCVGEPLITLTPAPGTSLEVAPDVHLGIGGAELNVAIHLARLGVSVAYAGAVGADPFGVRICEELAAEGVDDGELRIGAGPTGLYAKEPGPPARTLYYRDGSAGSALPALSPRTLAGIDLVHVTGVACAVRGELAATVRALGAKPRRWRLSFDVNHRPAMWSASEAGPALRDVAQAADTVFVGRDEAEAVWNLTARDAIRDLVGHDTELVLKDGGQAVSVWSAGRWWESSPPAIDVAEPVGAGDAFAAAFLAARLGGRDPGAAAADGHRLAGHVMSSVSDQGVRGDGVYAELRDR